MFLLRYVSMYIVTVSMFHLTPLSLSCPFLPLFPSTPSLPLPPHSLCPSITPSIPSSLPSHPSLPLLPSPLLPLTSCLPFPQVKRQPQWEGTEYWTYTEEQEDKSARNNMGRMEKQLQYGGGGERILQCLNLAFFHNLAIFTKCLLHKMFSLKQIQC